MDEFELHRSLLFSIAYRMLGSVHDAEDILQDAYLRYQAVDPEAVESPRALLTTIVTRLCLNLLASSRIQRETYLGPWLPECCHERPDGWAGRLSAHFLSALPEAPKCIKPIRFAYPDLDLEKSLHLRFSHRSPTIVADDPGSHRGESAPILAF